MRYLVIYYNLNDIKSQEKELRKKEKNEIMKKTIAIVLALLLVIGGISGILALTKKQGKTDYIPQIVTFTIGDIEYSVKQGETWQDFLATEKAPNNLTVSSDGYIYVVNSMGAYLYNAQNERVVSETIIQEGSYTLETFLIHFTIDSRTCMAENGMTWEEWIASKYSDSTLEIASDDKMIQKVTGYSLCSPENGVRYVYSNDVINNNWAYLLS